MSCPNCGTDESPLVVQRVMGPRSATVAYYHCAGRQDDGSLCDYSSWDREDFRYDPTPQNVLEPADVSWSAPEGMAWRYAVTEEGKIFENVDGEWVPRERSEKWFWRPVQLGREK